MERLATADRSNAGWQRDLSISHIKVGDMLVAQGRRDETLASYRASLAIAERLSVADRSNAGWQRNLAIGRAATSSSRWSLPRPVTRNGRRTWHGSTMKSHGWSNRRASGRSP
jgi:hypothetical protein